MVEFGKIVKIAMVNGSETLAKLAPSPIVGFVGIETEDGFGVINNELISTITQHKEEVEEND